MKKCAKVFVSLLMLVALSATSGSFTACNSSKSSAKTTMYPTKKYKTSKPIKDNYSIRGNNKKNGSTYHSY